MALTSGKHLLMARLSIAEAGEGHALGARNPEGQPRDPQTRRSFAPATALVALLLSLVPCAASALAIGTCTLTATTIDFGVFSGAEVDVTQTITITCSGGSGANNVNLRLSAGNSGNLSSPPRFMKSGANKLNYQIYADAAHTQVFGDGSAGTTKPAVAINYLPGTSPPPVTVTLAAFAVLPAQALPPSGSYIDTITASIEQQSSANTTFNVTANLPATCTVSAANLNFGTYSLLQLDGTSTISSTCTSTAPYNIGLGAGTSAGATVSNRAMTGPGGALLLYMLFQDAARTTNWGNTVGTDTVAATGTGAAQTFTVFGRIPSGQPAGPGSYLDTITVTLFF
jgi:spore coat protein U-like protein